MNEIKPGVWQARHHKLEDEWGSEEYQKNAKLTTPIGLMDLDPEKDSEQLDN